MFVGAFQADEALAKAGVQLTSKPESVVRGIMTLVFAGVIVVSNLAPKGSSQRLPGLGCFPDLCALPQAWRGKPHRYGRRPVEVANPTSWLADLKTAVRHEHFQLRHRVTVRLLGFKAGDQLLDFLFLSQEELWCRLFFFASAARSERVRSTRSCRYWAINACTW